MLVGSSFRESTRPEDLLEFPSRPSVEVTHLGSYHTAEDDHAGTPSAIYRITLVQQPKPKTVENAVAPAEGKLTRPRPLQPKSENSLLHVSKPPDIDVVQLEVFACVQRLNHHEITRWKQIAQVDLRKRKNRRNSAGDENKAGSDPVRSSIRIAGFYPGYRYQIVVRAVGLHGKRSLFSQPVFIIPYVASSTKNEGFIESI